MSVVSRSCHADEMIVFHKSRFLENKCQCHATFLAIPEIVHIQKVLTVVMNKTLMKLANQNEYNNPFRDKLWIRKPDKILETCQPTLSNL